MDRAQPVGLAIVGSHFRQKLVVRHAGRSDKPQLVADAAPYGPGHVDGQRQTGLVFGHVQKSLVQRERLDQIGVLMENAMNLCRHAPVNLHAPGHENQVGTQPHGPDRRHSRTDTVLSRLVAGRGYHAPALGTADNQRTAPVLGMVALLDGGIESVHVDMYDLALGHG